MKTQIVERVEFFSEAELESLEFLPEELEVIEEQRVPDLDSISFEDIAEELEAYFEGDIEGAELEARGGSHVNMKMAARIEYDYKDRQGKIHSGITTPVRYGGGFKQTHAESSERKRSRETACKAAWRDLPQLKQGEVWTKRNCKPFQQK